MYWKLVQLGNCCEIVSGSTPDTDHPEYWNGNIPWVTPKDLSKLDGTFLYSTPRKLTESGLNSCSSRILPINSVLFSSRAPIGLVAINTIPVATNQGFKSFIPDESRLYCGYLFWWLKSNRKYLNNLGNGATFKEVSKAIISKVEIPLPPLPEQRRIAAILDKAEALRAKRRAALAKMDQLAQSIFLEMFGDPATNPKRFSKVELSTLVRVGDNINYGVVQPGDDLDEGVPLIRVGDITDGSIKTGNIKRISPEIENSYKRSRLNGDEILVSCVGSIGSVALANSSVAGYNIARAVARIPPSNDVNRQYLAAYLRTKHIQQYFSGELRTVSQPTLNIKQLSKAMVILPPLPLQQAFAHRIEKLESLKTAHRASLAKLDALFASLQDRAFRGEL